MNSAFSFIQSAYAQALSSMDAEAAQIHPSGDKRRWNAQQVVEHLLLTYRETEGLLQARLQKGRPTRAPRTLHHRLAQALVLKAGWYPPHMKAPASVCPGENPCHFSGSELVSQMHQELGELDHLLEECEHRFGRGQIASHFALGPLTCEQWRCFHQFHARLHLKQLQRIQTYIHSISGRSSSTT